MTMGLLSLIFLVSFAATLTGAVMLLNLGGWLPILVAVLLLCSFMTHMLLHLCLAAGNAKRTNEKEEKP